MQPRHRQRSSFAAAALAACVLAGVAAQPATAASVLPHRKITLALPGAPAKLVAADMDRDGSADLLVIVVYTEYEEISFDRVEGFVQLTEVVPALSERREARLYLAGPGGAYALAGEPFPIPAGVSAIGAGTKEQPVLALTPGGIAGLELARGRDGEASLELVPLISGASVLREAQAFLPRMELMGDFDGSGPPDLLFPGREGVEIFRGVDGGLSASPSARLRMPGDRTLSEPSISRWYPIPAARDLSGDGWPELILPGGPGPTLMPFLLPGEGEGRFGVARVLDARCLGGGASRSGKGDLAFLGNLDGKGPGELVVRREIESEKDGLDEARKPRFIYDFHRLRPDLSIDPTPYEELEVTGYAIGELLEEGSPRHFRDLDGDGRLDLVTVTLDFSIFQVMRVLATKRIGIGLDFHIWSQKPGGEFERVEGLNLSDKMLLDLNDLRLDRLGNFTGDFDGDGRLEFMAYQGGRKLDLRRGAAGCGYGRKADMEIVLDEAPQDERLVRIQDLDGDAVSDLAVTRILEADGSGATPPVLLDLYLSGAAR